jgi:hypothetical protein
VCVCVCMCMCMCVCVLAGGHMGEQHASKPGRVLMCSPSY